MPRLLALLLIILAGAAGCTTVAINEPLTALETAAICSTDPPDRIVP